MIEFDSSTLIWRPLAKLGYIHPFFDIDMPVIIQTWVILLLFFIFLLPVRSWLKNKSGILRYLILTFIHSFLNLCNQTLGFFDFSHFAFITVLFLFIFICNSAAIIPWLEEPTKDLNTTLALGIISFLYVQIYAIKHEGLKKYITDYFSPFFIMLPLNIVGKLASIISISFRLFGNIFGGSMISHMHMNVIEGSLLFELLGLFTGINLVVLLFFGLFEGLLQAFVFSMLTLTYLSIALQPNDSQGTSS